MEQIQKWDLMLRGNQSPCFVTDCKTDQFVYANKQLYKFFDLNEDVLGKKFYEVIINNNAMFDEIRPDWSFQQVFETEVFSQKTNLHFHATFVLINHDNNVFCELHPYEDQQQKNSFEQAMTRCMEICEQPSHSVLISFMELICQYYNSEAAYTYSFGMDKGSIHCVAQWTINSEIQAVEEVNTVMNAKNVIDWLQKDSTPSMMIGSIHNEMGKNPVMAELLQVFSLETLVLCKVENGDNEVVGVVGLSNPKTDLYFDKRLISTISRFVAQEVTKEFMDATLFKLHHKDLLTGFSNRVGYKQKMDLVLEQKPKSMGVLSVNVNGVKLINQTSGIVEGDMHIKKASLRLKEHFNYEFFRLSGDEFVGIAPNVEKEELEEKVSSLMSNMRKEGNFDFSVGYTWAKDSYDFYKLVEEAEIIMFINKQEYYALNHHDFGSVNDTTLSELLTFLAEDEFMIYLQPQMRLEDSSLYGAEALVRRFDKKNNKMVFPDQFIALYEQKSVIRHVDIFVIETVCALLNKWNTKGKAIPISVNLSRVTLMEHGIVETIVKICDKYQIPHDLLVIEVTERVGLIENNVASSLITTFKENGFNISLDDFGCAYSNIVTLAQIEVDEVKLDKSLVDDLTTSSKNHILVKNVLTMCNELEGASTLAEGIEDAEQASLLHQLNCHFGQGYFYSRPIPIDEFEKKYIK